MAKCLILAHFMFKASGLYSAQRTDGLGTNFMRPACHEL